MAAIALLAVACAAEAEARSRCPQHVEPPSGDAIICVMPARIWRGGEDDIRNIETTPVPHSFRQAFEAPGACNNLVPHALIDWHLSFGSERSTAAALAYLEARQLRSVPATADYARELRRAWRAAQPDLACARTIRQQPGLSYSPQHLFMSRSRTITRFRSLLGALDGYLLLAEQSLRAAEEFGSLALVGKAEPYLNALVEAATFLQPLENEPAAANLLHFNLPAFRIDDLRMRAAVARARLTRSAEDVSRAEAIVDSLRPPDDRRIAELAFSGGQGFCDFGGGHGEEALGTLCRAESTIHERVTNYWINRALLDTVADPHRPDAIGLAMRLIAFEQREDHSTRCCWRSAREDQLRLLLARAERNARFAAGASATAGEERLNHWQEAAADLQRAEAIVVPADEPTRFRQVAEAWLSLWAQADRVDDPDDRRPGPASSPGFRRFNAYVRTMLERLDAIAVGEAPPRS